MSDNQNLGFYYCITCRHIAKINDALENIECEKCHSQNCVIFPKKITMPFYEMDMIRQISTDKRFWQAMVNLQENDIIEYQMKMNQIEQQVKQQKQQSNLPRCPRCGSTAITTGARGANFMWGLFGASKTVNRCSNCGHTWKPKR